MLSEKNLSNSVHFYPNAEIYHILEVSKFRGHKVMTKEEHLIRGIMGRGKAGRRDLRILIYAVEIYGRMLFDEKIPPEEILVTKSIYPDAGRKYGKNAESAGRLKKSTLGELY